MVCHALLNLRFGGIVKKYLLIAGLALFGSLSISTTVSAEELTPPPGPNDLTWAQVAMMNTGPIVIVDPAPPRTRAIAPSCSQNTGIIYKRTSGAGYPYGTVGIKPTVSCTVTMLYMEQTTTIYKTVWWGLQRQTTPITTSSSLASSVTTTNVQIICADLRSTEFQALVSVKLTFPNGSISTGSAWEASTLNCGTP